MGEICTVESAVQKIYIASQILSQMKECFEVPESIKNYIEDSVRMQFWACFDEDEPVGFLALKAVSLDTAELFVMGVKKANQRKGIGTQLVSACETYAVRNSFRQLQVKTLQKENGLFFEKMGFEPAEENSSQIYVKTL